MKIYKIAGSLGVASVTDMMVRAASAETDIANLKDVIRSLKDDIRDIKKDNKDVSAKVKKIDDILDKLNIGRRQITQVQNTFTELQRKVEKFEVVMQEWKNYKKEMNDTIRMEVEKKTRGQIAAGRNGNVVTALKKSQNVYDIYVVLGANSKLIGDALAYSAKQAINTFYRVGENVSKARDYMVMGWTLRAILNKEKTQEKLNKEQRHLEQQQQKEERAQSIYWD